MSDSIKLSSKGAFSYCWNKGLNSNQSYFLKCVTSIVGFFKGLFGKYTIEKSEAISIFSNDRHKKSIFFKECTRKIKGFNVEVVNNPDAVPKVTEHGRGENNANDEKQCNKKNTDNGNINTVSVSELEKLMQSKDFKSSDNNFSADKLKSIKADACLRLFNSAVSGGHSEIALRLLLTENCGELVKCKGHEKANALSLFANSGSVDGLQYLLKHGIENVNDADIDGNTPLCLAVVKGHKECVDVLLSANGIKVDIKNKLGLTPLSYAVIQCEIKLIDVLLDHGAQINLVSNNHTVFHMAVRKEGSAEALNTLLKRKYPNIISAGDLNKGYSALHRATIWARREHFNALIEADADVNVVDNLGLTPLHWAAGKGSLEFVEALLAVPGIQIKTDHKGNKPLDSLNPEQANYAACKQALENHK